MPSFEIKPELKVYGSDRTTYDYHLYADGEFVARFNNEHDALDCQNSITELLEQGQTAYVTDEGYVYDEQMLRENIADEEEVTFEEYIENCLDYAQTMTVITP